MDHKLRRIPKEALGVWGREYVGFVRETNRTYLQGRNTNTMIGRTIKDRYKDQIRTGQVIEDLDTHWRVDWGPNRTKIRKDRVGKRPKKQGPWWACRNVDVPGSITIRFEGTPEKFQVRANERIIGTVEHVEDESPWVARYGRPHPGLPRDACGHMTRMAAVGDILSSAFDEDFWS